MRTVAERLTVAWFARSAWLWLLWPLACLFRLLQWLRRGAYRLGLRPVVSGDIPVIVVGNITVGGSGKSPLVLALADFLHSEGYRPGIVSRGYGGSLAGQAVQDVNNDSSPDQVGDEPLMLRRRLGCPVVVSPRRSLAVRRVAMLGCDLALSDDGLQHYAMARRFEICVLDGQRGWGNGLLLPAGPLREPLARLRTVDMVVLGNCPVSARPDWCARLRQQRVAPERIVFTDLYPAALIASDGSRSMTLDQGRAGAIVQALFDGQTVHAVAGIGHPERFFQTLRELGLSIDVHPFADHHSYRREDFKGIDPARLIMTEKDAVKCSELLPAPFWVLRVEQQIPESLGRALLSCLEDARGSSPVPINHGRIERG